METAANPCVSQLFTSRGRSVAAHDRLKFYRIHLQQPLKISEITNQTNRSFPSITSSKLKIKAPFKATVEIMFNLNLQEAERPERWPQKCATCPRRRKLTAKRRQLSFCVLSAGHYVQDTCVYGPGDLPWIIQSPSLFANQFDSTEPLVVSCLERWHRLRVLGQAEGPVEAHWHFQRESHFNTELNRWVQSYRDCLPSYWYHSVILTWNQRTFNQKRMEK